MTQRHNNRDFNGTRACHIAIVLHEVNETKKKKTREKKKKIAHILNSIIGNIQLNLAHILHIMLPIFFFHSISILSFYYSSTHTYSYKKVNHKKYIECKIDLLCDIFAKPDAHLNIFIRCINKIYNKRCNT